MQVRTIQFSREAVHELSEAIAYYERQNEGLGIEFMFEFEKQIELIALHPFSRSVRYLDVRFAVLNRFPFAVHYTFDQSIFEVVVQMVLATSTDPAANWRK